MTTATATPTKTEPEAETPAPDFDAIERDIEQRLAALQEQRQSFALDALTDPEAHTQLEKIEGELADAEFDLGRLTLARAEQERREVAAAKAIKDEAQAAALDRAEKLITERVKRAEALDKAIVEFVKTASEFVESCEAQKRELLAAGLPRNAAGALGAVGLRIEGAVALAMKGKRTLYLERLPVIPGRFWRTVSDTEAEMKHI